MRCRDLHDRSKATINKHIAQSIQSIQKRCDSAFQLFSTIFDLCEMCSSSSTGPLVHRSTGPPFLSFLSSSSHNRGSYHSRFLFCVKSCMKRALALSLKFTSLSGWLLVVLWSRRIILLRRLITQAWTTLSFTINIPLNVWTLNAVNRPRCCRFSVPCPFQFLNF